MSKNNDPLFVSRARKKQLSQMLEKAFANYPIEQALRDADRAIKKERMAARQN